MSEQAAQTVPAPETGVEADDINAAAIAFWGTVSVLIVVVTILAATALYNTYQTQLTQVRVVEAKYLSSDSMINTQMDSLLNYDIPNTQRAGYTIPIDQAKKLVLTELFDSQKE